MAVNGVYRGLAFLAILAAASSAAASSAAASTSAAASAPCDATAFNVSLNGTQCFGLQQVAGVASYLECEAACCADAACQLFEWCPAGETCSGFSAACFTGQADLSKCSASPTWRGAARALPPRPPRPPQRFAPPYMQAPTAPLAELDLADEAAAGAWSVSVDGAPARAARVPGGGYNSDAQDAPFIDSLAVREAVVYSRGFAVPAGFGGGGGGAALRLAFGAVNHGAEVWVAPAEAPANATLAGVHYGPHMAFDVDVTALVADGRAYALTVVARPFSFFGGDVASGFRYPEAWSHPADGWGSRQCAGICKYVRLVALPPLRVAALVVRGQAAAQTATVEAVIANDGAADVPAGAAALTTMSLAPWDGNAGAAWPYPPLPDVALPALPAGAAAVINFTLDWAAPGFYSWWWPNRPFSESYLSQLHVLNATLALRGAPASRASQRFGLVEHAESSSFFYTLNGVRVNHLSDATPENGMSFYDAYANEDAFGGGGGARETWRRYMRLGVTSNRIHQSTPTQAMLDAADEVGLRVPQAKTRHRTPTATLMNPASIATRAP